MVRYCITKDFRIRFQAACDDCGIGPRCNVSGSTHLEAIYKAAKHGITVTKLGAHTHRCDFCRESARRDFSKKLDGMSWSMTFRPTSDR